MLSPRDFTSAQACEKKASPCARLFSMPDNIERRGSSRGTKECIQNIAEAFFSQTPVRLFLVLRVVKGGVIHRYATKDTLKTQLFKGGAIELAGLHAPAKSTKRRSCSKAGCRYFRTTLKGGVRRGRATKVSFFVHLPSRSAVSQAVCISNVWCLVNKYSHWY